VSLDGLLYSALLTIRIVHRLVLPRFRPIGALLTAFHLIGVLDRPSQPLDQLHGEVLALKVRDVYAFPKCHGAFPESSPRIRGNDDLRHVSLLIVVSAPFWDVHLRMT
jgi:hypothetical protein